ncbi:UDP-N-acetylmuramate--L-alanine ligase [Arcanobacterium bovis]|uniref:UDP-N-acetylmuramate--L-alanine ligase n=1 Tax=Arcanobacterium bovis TaxID=2529275 RepID=A0A4Q9V158_9ACTO|nr:UDP-N-acetylmuramate--L-alanine ligase [Arcanobacterium bovis]TBW22763.1 UDP-N-acetylmuramate--L-alanine ligase [Arcanobacterium bovis]
MKFHLIGIGGAGMSVVADLLMAQGHEVHGSDREDSQNVQRLRQAGAVVAVGHAAKNVDADAIVVTSSAIKPENPELTIARERGQHIMHRSQALALAAQNKEFIAVAGAHGKTSTTGMLAVALGELGLDPSRAIGGSLAGGASGGYLGSGNIIVAEADESDQSFLNYEPRIALVLNVEADHLDHYGSLEKFEQAFVDFAARIVPGGLLICCTDNDGSRKLAQSAVQAGVRVWTYGRTECNIGEQHAKLCEDKSDSTATSSAKIIFGGVSYDVDMSVPGDHMMLNAVGAWLVGIELGISGTDMARALQAFQGTGRRFERRGECGGVVVIDDYAHHPTEVEVTLRTARSLFTGNVRVLFQPHLYSRTKNFAQRFAQALSLADDVVVTSVYAAREVPSDGVEGDAITAFMPQSRYVADRWQAAREIARYAQPSDVILTVGAGDVTELADVIVEELEKNS